MMKPPTDAQIKIDALIAAAANHLFQAAGEMIMVRASNRTGNMPGMQLAWEETTKRIESAGAAMSDIVKTLLADSPAGTTPGGLVH